MKHRLAAVMAVLIVAVAAISGTPTIGEGASTAIFEAVPKERCILPELEREETVRGLGPPNEPNGLQISDEIVIAKRNIGDGGADIVGLIQNDLKSIMQSPVPSDNFTNVDILAAG